MEKTSTGVLRKQDAMQVANEKLLKHLCGKGDFLQSKRRCLVVHETFFCLANCAGCQELHARGREWKVKDLWVEIFEAEHTFGTQDDCAGLGVLVHAVANQQHVLTEEFYFEAADFLWKVLSDAGELPEAVKQLEGKELKEEKCIRLCELLDVIAASAGVRSYYRAMGLPMPQLPQPVEDETPHFRRVTEICSSGLQWDPAVAWAPRLQGQDVNLDVYKRLGMERTPVMAGMSRPDNPNSKWEGALTTAYHWFHWSSVAYPPNFAILQMKPFPGSKISRADMESIASAYTTGIHCVF